MNQAGDIAAVFRFDRDDIAAVADGDDGFLQIWLHGGGFDHLFELFAQLHAGSCDLPADGCKLRACGIGKAFFGFDGAFQQIGEIGVGLQAGEQIAQRCLHALTVSVPVREGRNLAQQPGDFQQLFQRDSCAGLCMPDGGTDILEAVEGG